MLGAVAAGVNIVPEARRAAITPDKTERGGDTGTVTAWLRGEAGWRRCCEPSGLGAWLSGRSITLARAARRGLGGGAPRTLQLSRS